jgi:hypothetical protein
VVHNDYGARFSHNVQGSKVTFWGYTSTVTSTDTSPKDDDTTVTWNTGFPILESMRMSEEDDGNCEAYYCPYRMSVYSTAQI